MKSHLLKKFSALLLITVIFNLSLSGQRNYPPTIEGADVELYKTAGEVELQLWIKKPESHNPKKPVPAIIFFFGGGWNAGSPEQFIQQADWLAGRGMVAVLADYRVKSRHQVPARICVADAKSAVRYLRKHADRLGIDPDRIVAGGGSAGGHLAAATGTLPGHDDPNDDMAISAVPNAMALFNPAVVLAPVPGVYDIPEEKMTELIERFDAVPESMSPFHNVKEGTVPTIIFHGTKDPTVPYASVELFHKKMKSMGNRCELVGYKGAGHGFFNSGKNNNIYTIDTLNRLDSFLVSLGYIQALPEVNHHK